ncbi:hypothetical protein G6F40_017884 [Rhizopus arrhizus]|nr:hypothetical protein G6F40_017884 [Rhizopus arrhizus]
MSGVALVIGSGCAANNVIDRDIDRLMERTCTRPMAAGSISIRSALTFACILGFVGFWLLYDATRRIEPLVQNLIEYIGKVGL